MTSISFITSLRPDLPLICNTSFTASRPPACADLPSCSKPADVLSVCRLNVVSSHTIIWERLPEPELNHTGTRRTWRCCRNDHSIIVVMHLCPKSEGRNCYQVKHLLQSFVRLHPFHGSEWLSLDQICVQKCRHNRGRCPYNCLAVICERHSFWISFDRATALPPQSYTHLRADKNEKSHLDTWRAYQGISSYNNRLGSFRKKIELYSDWMPPTCHSTPPDSPPSAEED